METITDTSTRKKSKTTNSKDKKEKGMKEKDSAKKVSSPKRQPRKRDEVIIEDTQPAITLDANTNTTKETASSDTEQKTSLPVPDSAPKQNSNTGENKGVWANESNANESNNAGAENNSTDNIIEGESQAETIVEVLSSMPKPVDAKALLGYANVIHGSAVRGFRPISIKELKDLLSRSQFPFHYTVKKRGNEFPNEIFIILTDGENKARCPVNSSEFIKIRE